MLRKVCCAGVVLFVIAIGHRQQGNKPAPAAELSQAAAATLALYGVEAWSDASLGNHRARLRLPSSVERGGVAWAHIQWRLPGLPMRERRLMLFEDGRPHHEVSVHVVSADSEAAVLVFEAPRSGGGDYLLYYLPYERAACVTGGASSCASPYKPPRPAHGALRERARALVAEAGWRERTPRADVVAMHARTARDAFFPMEVAATAAESAALDALAARGGRDLLVWPEGRERPIRMLDRLPLVWAAAGALPSGGAAYRGEALRGEFFAFQVGVYAPTRALVVLSSWSELRADGGGGAVIPAYRLRCINQPNGSAAAEGGLALARGEVLPLWFGVEVAGDQPPATYRGVLRVREVAAGRADEVVRLELVVGARRVAFGGDDELWRHSRLRWLDSTSGSDELAAVGAAPRAPWVPVAWDDGARTLRASGAREVKLTRRGLPASLRVGGVELLHGAAQLRLLRHNGRELRWMPTGALAVTDAPGGGQRWTADGAVDGVGHGADGECAGLRVRIRGEMQSDGFAQMTAVLKAARSGGSGGAACVLQDVQLVLPLVAAETPLINGFGWKGAARPATLTWRWDEWVDHAQKGLNCRVWVGSARAGVQLNLQGVEQSRVAAASHCGNDENGVLQCSDLTDAQFNIALGSPAWNNRNRGGASIAPGADGAAVLTVNTGRLSLPSDGAALTLGWRLLLTPVRGAGEPVRADFATRYFHMQRFVPVEEALRATPSPSIILHQGNQLNPYINYPFLTRGPLRAYVDEAHRRGAKVKLYYTVRELSASAAELWALRALRGEVIVSSGGAAGHAWLREHVRSNYTAAWHEVLADGEVDAAVQTPAFTGRWDNYWIEGILWLARALDVDGIYLDGAPYERGVLRRLRRALAAAGVKGDFKLDLHASCAGNPHLPYVELYPYLDSIWFGEQCNYAAYTPEQWLAEVSGVPFGLPGQVLGNNREQWHALLFGMTCRIYPDPHTCNPRPIWAAIDRLKLRTARLVGWWESDCPVRASHPKVRASLLVGDGGAAALVLASWAGRAVDVAVAVDAAALRRLGVAGANTSGALRFEAPEIDGFQPATTWRAGDLVRLQAKGSGWNEGWLAAVVG